MASDVIIYGCIPLFVATSRRVLNQSLERLIKTKTSFRANISILNIELEMLP